MSILFPYEIYNFVKKYDVPTRLIPSASRFQELKLTESISPVEIEEMNALAVVLEPYNIVANDYNELFNAVNNVQKFVKEDIVTYLNGIFAIYDTRVSDMRIDVDSKITEVNNTMTEFDSWYIDIRVDITKLQSFNFDNASELKGCRYFSIKNADGSFTDTITNSTNGKNVAIRNSSKTTMSGVKKFIETTTVYDTDGVSVLKTSTSTEYKDNNGNWIKEVV